MNAPFPKTKKRLLELDALRGIAALGVLFYHYTTWYNELYHHSQGVLFYFPKGKYGVELFFIISGFVIFMTLERVESASAFIVGRVARLYPAYWAAIILTFTVVTINGLPGHQVTWSDALINLTMFQDFFDVPSVDKVYWTLSCELSFYIIMLFLYKAALLKHIGKVSIGWLLLAALFTVLGQKVGLVIEPRIEGFFLLKNAMLFVIGMMIYRLYQEGFSTRSRYIIIAVSLLVYKLQDHSWAEVLIISLFVAVLIASVGGQAKFLNKRVLIFLGGISYSLYLIHQNIGYVVIRSLYEFDLNPNTSIFIAILVSLSLSIVVSFFIEQPMLAFIKGQYKSILLKRSC